MGRRLLRTITAKLGSAMSALSEDTIRRTIFVMRKHITNGKLVRLLDELQLVPGNAAFREVIRALFHEAKRSELDKIR